MSEIKQKKSLDYFNYWATNFSNLSYLRFVAITLVVLRHSLGGYTGLNGLEKYYGQSDNYLLAAFIISLVSMPLFVSVSGFLFAYLREVLGKYENFSTLILKKFQRLIIPLFVFIPINILIYNPPDLYTFLLNGAGHLWYLLMLFPIFLLVYKFEYPLKRYSLQSAIIILILALLEPLIRIKFGYILLCNILKYLPFFLLGYYIFLKGNILLITEKKNILKLTGFCIILIVVVLLILNYSDSRLLLIIAANYYHIPVSILTTIIIFSITFKTKKLNANPFIAFITNNSYYLYLIHLPFLLVYYKSVYILQIPSLINCLLAFMLSCLFSLGCSHFLLKSKIGRLIIGEKINITHEKQH